MYTLLPLWWSALMALAELQHSPVGYNNRILEEPEVQCGHNTIKVRVKTENQRPSYIFAKGHFRDPECSFRDSNNATFTFDHCNINRKREVNPRGMAYSLTVIVQLHPLFITKIDRAYNVRCFYMEENKEVNAEFAVSDLMTTVIQSGHAMPECTYTLHRDSPNGPVLRYARVGDLIYHVWECPSDVYAMLVHTCSILDGHGDEHIVVDSTGCSTDDYIIPQLTYSNDLTRSFTGANVVNLPDSESVYFSCQIKLCLKSGDYCDTFTPPACHNNHNLTQTETIEEVLDSDQLIATTVRAMSTPTDNEDYVTKASPAASTVAEMLQTLRQEETENIEHMTTAESIKVTGSIAHVRDAAEFTTVAVEGSGLEEVTEPSTNTKSQVRFKKSMKALNDEVVDVDVSTPELRIIENELGFPDFAAQRNTSQGKNAVCISLLGVWVLTIITLIAITAAVITVYSSVTPASPQQSQILTGSLNSIHWCKQREAPATNFLFEISMVLPTSVITVRTF